MEYQISKFEPENVKFKCTFWKNDKNKYKATNFKNNILKTKFENPHFSMRFQKIRSNKNPTLLDWEMGNV